MPQVLVPANLPYDAVLLSREKWTSIQGHLTREQEEAARRHQIREARERRQATSKQMKDDWPNTLAKLHAKRLKDREDRLRKKEEDQLAIDAEEAKIQAAIRKEKLDAAREMLFHDEDQVRGIDSALLLSEVIKERDEQVKLKKRLQQEEQEREKQWQKHLHWDWAEQARVEAREARERRAALHRSNAKEREFAMHYKEQMKEKELEEARQVRLATEQYNKMVEEEKLKRWERTQLEKKEALEFLRRQRAFELLKTCRDQEENAEIRVYGRGKLGMAKQILSTKREILDRATRRSERACALLEERYKKAADDEDARIAAVVAEKQAQKDAEEAAKAAARAAMNKAINEHRLADLALHREQERLAGVAKLEERKRIDDETVRMAQELRDRQQDLIDQREQNRKDWKDQQEDVEAKKLAEKYDEIEEVRELNCTAKREKEKFQHYVEAEMKRLKESGRNTFPLKVAAKVPPAGFLRHSTDWSNVGIRPY